jgi:hypothetical protein
MKVRSAQIRIMSFLSHWTQPIGSDPVKMSMTSFFDEFPGAFGSRHCSFTRALVANVDSEWCR